MGDKIASKRFAAAAGVSCVPGPSRDRRAEHAARIARRDRLSGDAEGASRRRGKGIRVVRGPAEIAEALSR